jgi:hypothetical protein
MRKEDESAHDPSPLKQHGREIATVNLKKGSSNEKINDEGLMYIIFGAIWYSRATVALSKEVKDKQ